MLNGLRSSLLRELDFKLEAGNLITFSENLREFEQIIIPGAGRRFLHLTSPDDGYIFRARKITDLSPLRLDGNRRPRVSLVSYFALTKNKYYWTGLSMDPHPGNVFLTEDDQIALLDLGMVVRLLPGFRDNVLRLLLAISEAKGRRSSRGHHSHGRAETSFLIRLTSRNACGELVAEHGDASLSRLNAGQVVLEITKISADCWFRLPSEFTMVAKTLLNLDRVMFTLDPTFRAHCHHSPTGDGDTPTQFLMQSTSAEQLDWWCS